MFSAYDAPSTRSRAKRLTVSTAAAVMVLTGLGAGALLIARRPAPAAREKTIDVAFRPPPPPPKPVKLENAPIPPARRLPPNPTAAVAHAPVAAPSPAPAAAPMVAPREVPKGPAPESNEAVAARVVAVGGSGDGTGTATGPTTREVEESPAPVEAHAAHSGPVNLPEEADPPEPDENNAPPEYPELARTTGQEARVVVKVVVEKDGRVGKLNVLKGEEPFLSAAVAAVKTWRFTPAMLEGTPIAVFLTIPVKFSLRE